MAEDYPVRARPTSHGHLTLARVAAFATSVSAGVAVGLVVLPDAWQSGGLMVAAPLIPAVVVTLGLASAWHMLLGYGAHAKKLHERAIAFGLGFALFLVGAGSSAWSLVSLIGGQGALQSYRLTYVERLKEGESAITSNATVDSGLIGALDTASGNLASMADAEAKSGLISGKVGRAVVFATLKNASDSVAAKSAALGKLQDGRAQLLAQAQDTIEDASRAASQNDRAAFEEAAAKAASELRAASAIRLTVSDLGIGMALDHARAPIERVINDVSSVMRDVNARQRRVDIPLYRPIDARMAVLANPQPLPWIVAMVIETLPLTLLGLLLTLWREEASPLAEIHPFGRKQPFVAAAE